MEVLEAIRTKRAVRTFADRPLTDHELETIANAGRRAQSAKNRQAWHFILVRDRATLEALSKLGHFAGQLAGAAAAVVILTPDPAERWSVMFDAGQAAAYMQLAAWQLGIGSCPVTIYEPEQARDLLGFPEQLHVRAVLSLGYPDDPVTLSSPPRAGGRKLLSEIVSHDRYEPSPAEK